MKIQPTQNRVILKFFLGAYVETIQDGIIIPADAAESMAKTKPKYRWVEILAVGPGCLEAKVGQEALVWDPNVEFIAVKGEKPFNYIQEGQIMALREPKIEAPK
jgi:co-chaperonin GroES (HSP10)